MRNFCTTSALFLLLFVSACGQSKKAEVFRPNEAKEVPDLTIRYIANEGVLIRAGDRQILIDGLHREYRPAYAFLPTDSQNALETARAPYDKIDLLLVSHVHLDHFHAEAVASYLKNNPKAALVSSPQAADEIAKNFPEHEKIKPQIKRVAHEWKKSFEYNRDGIKIKFLGLRHSGERFREIQNFGHLIELGGKKFLHIGDADMTAENFSAFNLAKENIDVAFIPYWFLLSDDGRALVKEQFNAKQVIAVHVPPAEAEEISARFKKEMPDLITFTRIFEEKRF